jgi:hypothetical protein
MMVAACFVAPIASAAPTPGSYFHWNMQGLLGRGTSGSANDLVRDQAANYVVTRAQNEGFIAISLNEVCPVEALLMGISLQGPYSNHYAERFNRPFTSGAGQRCVDGYGRGQYGNQIFERYTLDYYDAYYNGLPEVHQDAYGNQTSWLWPNTVCIRTNYILIGHHACTEHYSGRPSEQVDLQNYTLFSNARFRVMMGDLNQPRSGLPLSYWAYFREADQCPTTGCPGGKKPTTDSNAAIDYIWIDLPHTSPGKNVVVTKLGYSDHHSVRGYFNLY